MPVSTQAPVVTKGLVEYVPAGPSVTNCLGNVVDNLTAARVVALDEAAWPLGSELSSEPE